MLGPLISKLAPFDVILRRIGPTSEDAVIRQTWPPFVAIRIRVSRESLRHETDLGVRAHAALKIRIENAINTGPIVDGNALGVFAIGIGRTPFQRRRAVARVKEVVCPAKNVFGPQLPDLGEQLLTVFHRGVVWFVATK